MTTKTTTLVFYGTDGDAAKAVASQIRKSLGANGAFLRHADAFTDTEECDSVILMPDVSDYHGARIEAAYDDKVRRAQRPVVAPPPPPVTQRQQPWLGALGTLPPPPVGE